MLSYTIYHDIYDDHCQCLASAPSRCSGSRWHDGSASAGRGADSCPQPRVPAGRPGPTPWSRHRPPVVDHMQHESAAAVAPATANDIVGSTKTFSAPAATGYESVRAPVTVIVTKTPWNESDLVSQAETAWRRRPRPAWV